MIKEVLKKIENDKEKEMTFFYKLVQNEETNTFHIIKAPVDNFNNIIDRNKELVYKHNSNELDKFSLKDVNIYLNEIDFNLHDWGYIENIRLASAILANQGYNVCGNCVRELYKN